MEFQASPTTNIKLHGVPIDMATNTPPAGHLRNKVPKCHIIGFLPFCSHSLIAFKKSFSIFWKNNFFLILVENNAINYRRTPIKHGTFRCTLSTTLFKIKQDSFVELQMYHTLKLTIIILFQIIPPPLKAPSNGGPSKREPSEREPSKRETSETAAPEGSNQAPTTSAAPSVTYVSQSSTILFCLSTSDVHKTEK